MPLPFSNEFLAALQAGLTPVLLSKIVLTSGDVLLYCSGGCEVTWAGLTYLPDDFDRIEPANYTLGADITTLMFNGFLGDRVTLDDLLFKWDKAKITFLLVFPIPDPAAPYRMIGDPDIGAWLYDKGFLSKVDTVDDLRFKAEFESVMRLFWVSPPNEMQQKCDLTFTKGKCPVNAADVEYAVTLTDVSEDGLTLKFTASPVVGFERGLIRMTSGESAGLQPMGIKQATNVGTTWTVVLYDTFPLGVAIGDTAIVREDCRNLRANCDLFNPDDGVHSAGWPYRGFDPPGTDWLISSGD